MIDLRLDLCTNDEGVGKRGGVAAQTKAWRTISATAYPHRYQHQHPDPDQQRQQLLAQRRVIAQQQLLVQRRMLIQLSERLEWLRKQHRWQQQQRYHHRRPRSEQQRQWLHGHRTSYQLGAGHHKLSRAYLPPPKVPPPPPIPPAPPGGCARACGAVSGV